MCTARELKDMLTETYNGLSDIFGNRLENLLLYGSYARGDQTEESDVDVLALIHLDKMELAKYRRQVSDLTSNLDLQYGVLLSVKLQDVDTFRQYSSTLPFFMNVEKEGISIVQ